MNIIISSTECSATASDFDIDPGLIDFRKKTSLSLFLQKVWMVGMHFFNSAMKFSMGLNLPLSPLARIWAKYLLSFESKATASLELSAKFFIITNIMSSSREEA